MPHIASIPSPTFQFFEIGPLRIHLYALCILTGIILATIWTSKRLRARGGDAAAVFDFTVWAVVLGIVFARFYHVVTHWGDFFGAGKNPLEVFAVWNGGIAIFGALIGGALGAYIASRITGVRFWSLADALVPGLLLAQATGRLGNYINNELFGGPTDLPWGLEIDSTNSAFPVGLPEGTLFHPTFLYEILWNLAGIVLLLIVERIFQPRWGKFFGMYLIWYGIGRFIIEGMRLDPSYMFFGFRTNQWAAFIAIFLGLMIIRVQSVLHTGLEISVYRPGILRPGKSILADTEDETKYFHVLRHDSAGRPIGRLEVQPTN